MSGENLDFILTSLIVADEKERLENFITQQQKDLKNSVNANSKRK